MQDWQLIELIYTKVAFSYKVNRKDIIERKEEVRDARRAVTALMITYLGYETVADLFYITASHLKDHAAKKLSSLKYDLRFVQAQQHIFQEILKSGYKFIA